MAHGVGGLIDLRFLAGTAITTGFTRESLNLYFCAIYIPKFLLFIKQSLEISTTYELRKAQPTLVSSLHGVFANLLDGDMP